MQKTLQRYLATDDTGVSRMEVLEGPTGRRRWSDDLKAQMVAETLVPGARVCDVAKRHGIAPQYLTTLRGLAREGRLTARTESAGGFAAVELDLARPPSPPANPAGAIEIVFAGVTVRVPVDVPATRIGEIAATLRRAG